MSKHELTLGKYTAAFVALLLLTGLTFGLSFASLGPLEWLAALGIAAAKSVIVALYFMHLIEMPTPHRLAGVIAATLLAILILLAMADVWTRAYEVAPAIPQLGAKAEADG